MGGACWKTAMVVKAYVGFSGASPICDGISRKGVLYGGKSVYNLSFFFFFFLGGGGGGGF